MNDTIKGLLIKPMELPEIVEIPNGLDSLQSTVGGDIEALYPYDDPVALICNDEGKINRLPLNRALRDDEGDIYDIVAGTFFICDASGEDFNSLTDEQIEKYREKFIIPEVFISLNGKIAAIPLINP